MFENFALNGLTMLGDKILEASKTLQPPKSEAINIPAVPAIFFLTGALYLSVDKLIKINEFELRHVPVSLLSLYIGIFSLGLFVRCSSK